MASLAGPGVELGGTRIQVTRRTRRLPGRDDRGALQANQLAAWIKNVREACTKLSRLDVADVKLGKLLSCALAGEDGIWPCEPVRIVLEDV